jgi:hypothetical protein
MSDTVAWGFTPGSRVRHAFAVPRSPHMSAEAARRTVQPHSLCCQAWAPKWPPANPDGWSGLPCRTCERLAEDA